ncbi:transposase, MuDR [Artemisia annua]|uniref:Transposase, MuDR n=1 Tax=Artemisia annua TaxID=35608 RepID=A0A2U1Q2R5_ARTAN|nr:transposase, MuDR [Artemisia annua]
MFTLEIHHNDQFTSTPGRIYLFGDTHWFDGVHCDVFSMGLLGEMLEDLCYTDRTLVYTHFRLPGESLDDGLLPLKSDEDVKTLVELNDLDDLDGLDVMEMYARWYLVH